MSNIQLVVWENFDTYRRMIRLQDGERYVETHINKEDLIERSRLDLTIFIGTALQKLCEEWNTKYGGRTLKVVAPQAEGQEWLVVEDDVIDGELVIHELPGPDASLRALPSSVTTTQGDAHA